MKVTLTKNKPKSKGPSSRLQKEWQWVGRLQKKNAKLQVELDALLAEVRPQIAEVEEA